MKTITYYYILLFILIITSCVQQTHPKTISVLVDMNGVENPTNVGIRGNNPLSWNTTTLLSDANNDGIYEGLFEMNTAKHTFEFKFVNHDSLFELQDQGNRKITFKYQPETIIYKGIFNTTKNSNITTQ